MSNKIKIAKAGYNALTETNPDNLVLSSDYNTLKYYLSGNITVNFNDDGSIYTGTFAHSLGYIPFFIVYIIVSGTAYANLVPNDQHTGAGDEYYNAYADATNLYFTAYKNKSSGVGGSKVFYYKIFKNNVGL